MDVKVIFDEFVKDVQTTFPDLTFDVSTNIEEAVSDIENKFLTHILKILKREPDFFSESRVILGINVSQLWYLADIDDKQNMIWKHVLLCTVGSVLHGDIKTKFSKILEVLKSVWTGDEIGRILNDDKSESRLKELFDFVMNTRIAKLFIEFVETVNLEEFEELKNIDQILEFIRNPDHPILKKMLEKVQRMLQQKLQRGHFTQQEFHKELETIKAKITSIFGGMIFGDQKPVIPSAVLMGNSAEARRQRMVARLQKKLRDKK